MSASGDGIELVETPQVFVVGADGAQVRRLSSGPGSFAEPSWSPDARRLAVETSLGGKGGAVVVIDDAGAVTSLVGAPRMAASEPRWSPDGQLIAFVHPEADEQHSAIRTIRPDGGDMETLATRSLSLLGTGLEWSPDGSRIVFVAEQGPPIRLRTRPVAVAPGTPPPPGGPVRGGQIDVTVVDMHGAHRIRLGAPDRDEFDATWSPDGRRLLVLSRPIRPARLGTASDLRVEVWDIRQDQSSDQRRAFHHPHSRLVPRWADGGDVGSHRRG